MLGVGGAERLVEVDEDLSGEQLRKHDRLLVGVEARSGFPNTQVPLDLRDH